jgi:prepilin-type processing-associated H-X9-DG protein
MVYLPGILGVLCLGLAFVLPFAKGQLPGPLAFLLAIAFCAIQVILGLVVIIRRPHAAGGQGKRRTRPLLVGLGCVAMWAISLPAFNARMMAGTNRLPCPSHLRQIGEGIMLYALDHGGAFPPSLAVLAGQGDLAAEVFVCPSSDDPVATGATRQEIASKIASGGHCSYLYFGAGFATSTWADAVVACDRLENHAGEGVNVLFADGHVEWIAGDEAQRLLDEIHAGHNPPRPATMPSSPAADQR